MNPIIRIVSGAQTGVDRGALDASLEINFPCSGFCPKGRRAEDGKIPSRYPVTETSSASYPHRTALNVIHSDATLILFRGKNTMDGGTKLTVDLCRRNNKPCLLFDFELVKEGEGWWK